MTDPKIEEAARRANVQVIDISDIEASDSFRHNRFVGLAAYYPKLSGRDGTSDPEISGKPERLYSIRLARSFPARLSLPARSSAETDTTRSSFLHATIAGEYL